MSRFYGDFDPAATASTLTETIQSDGSIAGVAQNIFPLSSDLSNTGAGDGSLSSVDALTFSSAVGTPYGPGSALRINDTSPRTRAKVSSSAAAVEMIEFSSAFTFEFWLHRDTDQNSGGKMFIDGRPNGQHSQLTFRLYFLDGKLTHDKGSQTGGTQPVVQTATTAATGVWQHYALARESDDTLRMFYDGAVVLTTSFAFTYDNQATGGTPILFTDPNVTNNFKAYVRDLRIIKDACLYTTAFTVPNEPLTATNDGLILATGEDIRTHSHVWNYTDVYDARFADTWPSNTFDTRISLYLPFDEDFRDLSSYGHTASSAGGASIQSSIKQHGAGSLLLNGTDQYVTIPNHASFQFGSGDFTIEAWVYQTATAGSDAADRHPIVSRMDGSTNRSFHVGIVESSGQQKLQFSYTTDGESGTSGQYTFDCDVTINAWHNVAIVREGSNLYGFLNGTSLSSSTAGAGAISSKTIFVGTSPLTIGYRGLSDQYFQGYIDDVRVTKGLAVYTTSYSVRTDPVGGSLTINP
tara:strand:+ start:1004 stop:2572 length:1569 start_codon:yes stop_codon:yes gene_type:complete